MAESEMKLGGGHVTTPDSFMVNLEFVDKT
jgi:hypothetical protein